MKPLQFRRPGAQDREWPAAQDDFGFRQKTVALLARSRSGSAWRQVARRCERRPCFANFAVIPASRVGQLDYWINRFNRRSVLGADVLNAEDVDSLHGTLPEPFDGR